jgi:RND family efflux transporter MFP subunit
MKRLSLRGRTLGLFGVLGTLLALVLHVAWHSGPLAPVPVTVATVESRAITPALFGIGTVEARYAYKIGPTVAGRLKQVGVQVGDLVRAGQVLGEMDPVDVNDRIAALDAAINSAEANLLAAQAQVQDATARAGYADAQAQRYEQLGQTRTASAMTVESKRQDRQVAQAGLAAARANLEAAGHALTRSRAERDGVIQQRANLRLVAPVAGLVVQRAADPGTTVVAGQTVVEVIDPASLWVNVRFDQLGLAGLRAGLPARIVLRSRAGQPIAGHVLRVEPVADAVTEETLAKVVFDRLPETLPPIGELAEVTVTLPALGDDTMLPNASLHRVGGQLGVWALRDGTLRYAPVKLGASDLDGRVQILDGLDAGERVVVYSQGSLHRRSRIKVVETLASASP